MLQAILEMKAIATLLLVIMLTVGCNSDKPTHDILLTSKFNLQTDLFDFATKMQDGDTLIIFANLSGCHMRRYEENTLIKKDNKIWIKTLVDLYVIEDEKFEFGPVNYNLKATDNLSFEKLFSYLDAIKTNSNENKPIYFIIKYKNDVVKYYSEGIDGAHFIPYRHYIQIMDKLYPNIEIYDPLEPLEIIDTQNDQ
jgi:hypothetical protein